MRREKKGWVQNRMDGYAWDGMKIRSEWWRMGWDDDHIRSEQNDGLG